MSKPWAYENLCAKLQAQADGSFQASHSGYRIGSHFQPIVSLTHARVVGHEGLMRPLDARQQAVSPHRLLQAVEHDQDQLLVLDRLARLLHIANSGGVRQGWLFLNMHPSIFAAVRRIQQDVFFSNACQEFDLTRGHVVVEVLEHSLPDEVEFAEAVAHIHEQGCLVALDDFGAGHSNFDRVWKISPEIVKLDRVFALGAENDRRIRRLLPRIVSLLHEAGVFVVLEGIETRAQAMIALDANIDFAQGDYFGQPQPRALPIHSLVEPAARLWRNYESDIVEQQRVTERKLDPYKQALDKAAATLVAMAGTASTSYACRDFLALPDAECCYLLDGEGRQIGHNIWRADFMLDPASARFSPVYNIAGARWARRPYFHNAMEHVGKVQATLPYLSTSSAHLCITVSLAFHLEGEARVLCGDIVCE